MDLVERCCRRRHHGPSVKLPSVSGTRSEMKSALKMRPRRMKPKMKRTRKMKTRVWSPELRDQF